MKQSALNLMKSLLNLHRKFLELERLKTEACEGQKLSPLDFFNRLTQDPAFEWLRPLSKIITDLDILTEEDVISPQAQAQMLSNIKTTLAKTNIKQSFDVYQASDAEFKTLYADFTKAMAAFEN